MAWPLLPPEMIETILTFLDLDSIKALRLANRSLAIHCIGPRFLQSIKQPYTTLTAESLASVDALVSNTSLRQKVRRLTVFGVYYATEEASAEPSAPTKPRAPLCERPTDDLPREDRETLTWPRAHVEAQNAFPALARVDRLTSIFKTLGKLQLLKLDLAIQVGPGLLFSTMMVYQPEIWTRASKAHEMVISALFRSRIPVVHLDVYSQIERYGIFVADHTLQMARQRDLLVPSPSLERLDMAVCTDMDLDILKHELKFENAREIYDHSFRSGTEIPREEPRTAAPEELGIVRLLRCTPNLRHLNLWLYHSLDTFTAYSSIVTAIADQIVLPQLESFSLSGFPVTQESLLRFLSRHQTLKGLYLRNIRLRPGTWPPIFTHINTEMSLSHAHFASLWWWKVDSDQEHLTEEDGELLIFET